MPLEVLDESLSDDLLFTRALAGAHCSVALEIERLASPGVELQVLWAYCLFRSGEPELAIPRVAAVLADVVRRAAVDTSGLRRWVTAKPTDDAFGAALAEDIGRFYSTWDAATFWRALVGRITHRELDFIACMLADPDHGFRVMVAAADAMKLRGPQLEAYRTYLAMCRMNPTRAVLENVLTLALRVAPHAVPALADEFASIAPSLR